MLVRSHLSPKAKAKEGNPGEGTGATPGESIHMLNSALGNFAETSLQRCRCLNPRKMKFMIASINQRRPDEYKLIIRGNAEGGILRHFPLPQKLVFGIVLASSVTDHPGYAGRRYLDLN